MRVGSSSPESSFPEVDPNLDRALQAGSTLPASWYTDPAYLALERARIFRHSWQYAGRAEQLAKPGDYFTCHVGEIPIIAVCTESGERRAYVNVCPHRASELVLSPAGNRKTLQCHYHAWTFGLDGALRGVPCADENPDLQKASFALRPVQLAAFGPFLFVHPDLDAPPFERVLGELPQILQAARAELTGLRYMGRLTYELKANWKVVVENYLECYHCPASHKGFSDLIDIDRYRTHTHEYFSVQRGPLTPAAAAAVAESIAKSGGPEEGLYAYVWPNFMVNVYPGPGNASMNLIIPLDVDRTLAIYEFYYSDAYSDEEVKRQTGFIDEVQREDIVICESVQRGLASGFYGQGRLVLSRENGIQHFQRLLLRTLQNA